MADRIIVKDSDEEEEDANIPSSAVCGERCQQFSDITGTDTALAMFYLQDKEWILEAALDEYFQSQQHQNGSTRSSQSLASSSSASSSTASTVSSSLSSNISSESKSSVGSTSKTESPLLQPKNEGRVRVLSWNIDGLDPNNLTSRTDAVCKTLNQEKAEIVFLQEVVDRSLKSVKSSLPNYKCFCGLDDPSVIPLGAYFTAILIRRDCSDVESVNVASFPGSKMDRTLLEVQCKIKGVPLTLITSHLESTAEYSDERRRQLKIAFDRMRVQTSERTVIFGGDLNLRDKELKGDSAKPDKVYDLWECTGKRPEAKFTWDLTINDNKQIGKFQPRCRFDRIYIRHPEKTVRLKPVYFELAGIQRLASCHRFASDHWAILAHLDVKSA